MFAHQRHISRRKYAALGHDNAVIGDGPQQFQGSMQRNAKRAQVAVVNAD